MTTPNDPALWPDDDCPRNQAIQQNGNTGEHYLVLEVRAVLQESLELAYANKRFELWQRIRNLLETMP